MDKKVTEAQKPQLYAKHVKVQPRDVKGRFRNLKWGVLAVLLGLYYIVPWLRYDRGPDAPDQLVLLDIAGRRGYFGPIEIWPQEVYYLTGLLILGAIGLFFATALFGRVWCGFTCPQTVWTDLFMLVERWIEGDRNKRIRLDQRGLSIEKLGKKISKHLAWLIIALLTGGVWVFYFVNAPEALPEIVRGQASGWTYSMIALFTFTTYVLAGWAREQVCIYMCPWPRFQSAMFDEDSLIVTYEEWRGEPRGNAKPGADFSDRGDCIDCKLCVLVCPTGIDIRDGNQMACIGCALCVDACDGVMQRFGLPPGLVAYDSNRNQVLRSQGKKTKIRLVRPRTLVYSAVLLVVMAVMFMALAFRSDLEINIQRDRAPLYVTLSDGSIRNGYTFKVLNMARQEKTFTLSLEKPVGAQLKVIGYQDDFAAAATLPVKADTVGSFKVYVRLEKAALGAASTPLVFVLKNAADGTIVTQETAFIGPKM